MNVVNDLIIILSLSLTVPFLAYCADILNIWGPSAKESFTAEHYDKPGSALARGIYVGFGAAALDNLYWLITWALVLMDISLGTTMMLGGSLANVFFRQTGGLYAARQHVIAAYVEHDLMPTGRLRDRLYWFASLVFALFMLIINDWES